MSDLLLVSPWRRKIVEALADAMCLHGIWRLCSAVFADHVYVNLDLIGAERSEKVAFVELRDVAPIT